MKRLLIFLVGLIMYVILTSELTLAQEVVWNHTFEFSSFKREIIRSVQQTSDGGYILGGEIYSIDASWLLKTDSEGVKEWDRTFKGSDDDRINRIFSAQQTSDGGYIVSGTTYGANENTHWLIKIDSEGQEEWKKIFNNGPINFAQQTSDGGYIRVGSSRSACWLSKTDSEGQIEWEREFGDGVNTVAINSVQQTSDEGYILAGGYFSSQSLYCAFLIKTDSQGQKEWERKFSDGRFCSSAKSVQQTSDGGYIIAGDKDHDPGGNLAPITRDGLLIKTDSEGQTEWERIFGEEYRDVYNIDPDNECLSDKYSPLCANSAKQTLDGGYILAIKKIILPSDFNRESYIIKTDSEGQKEWDKTFSCEGGSFSSLSVIVTSDGDYVVAGSTSHISWSQEDAWLAKIREELPVSVEEFDIPETFVLSQNYPNPFNPTTEIGFVLPNTSYVTLEVFNALGQTLTTLVDETREAGNHQVLWDGAGFPTGIYFYRLKVDGLTKTMKMLLTK